ncbi:MAG: lysozyme inhibitor LprI family protein [Methylococcales bacterium]
MNKNRTETLKILLRRLLLSLLISGYLPSPASAREHSQSVGALIPKHWSPSLDQLKETLEASSKTEPQPPQQAMNLTSQNLADIRDAQLFIVYVQLMQKLNLRERKKLLKEQILWLEKRAESASASVTSKGGSLAPLEHSAAFSEITEKRLKELLKRLQPAQTPETRK